jgi:hypothetical protein
MIIPAATGLRPVDLDSECYFAETARGGRNYSTQTAYAVLASLCLQFIHHRSDFVSHF